MQSLISDEWHRVDGNLWSARRRLQTAENEEDFQAVGVLCRETVISLGRAVFDERLSTSLSKVSSTDAKTILAKYFDLELPGSSNQELRSYAKSCLSLANSLQHNRAATYTQAELCIEACAHLVVIVRILFFKEVSAPYRRFRPRVFASAESDFMTTCVLDAFNTHPVAKGRGLTWKGLVFQGPEITLLVTKDNRDHAITLHHPYWWRGANRLSADMLLDEFLVRLLTELEKEDFIKSGQPPA